jgi:hypothetical protein
LSVARIKRAIAEETVGRKFIDCRETPGVMNCSIAISADSEEEHH